MFYSQFILAKKGPLGTIWIAAHLERKLRKNQVADTDIGVSVDSILFPEVPIALRLSSHLLLGVVRIYSKKVNYLFDDCSEALLKVKQAFRSTAVDLPPEQSKAPYHSITLPETFDLDDFELPDNEMFQGNFVDHHVSAKEQITLQDTMDGVSLPTSQFGLDERFGDGDASQIGLDLDEELFMDKGDGAGTSGNLVGTNGDPPVATKESSHSKSDEIDEDVSDPPLASNTNYFSIQAPSTPGLMGEPNLPSAKEELQASDEHMDDHFDDDLNPSELAPKEVSRSVSSPIEPSDLRVSELHANENLYYMDKHNEQVRTLETESMDFAQPTTFRQNLDTNIDLNNVGIIPENERTITENAVVMDNKIDINGTYHPLHDVGLENNLSYINPDVQISLESEKSVSELRNLFQPCANLQNVETSLSNFTTPVLQACTSKLSSDCNSVDNVFVSSDFPPQEDGSSFGTALGEGAVNISGTNSNVGDALEPTSKEDQITHGVNFGNKHLEGNNFEKENNLELSNFPPPELLLSMPYVPSGPTPNFGVHSTPSKELFIKDGENANDENLVSGKKRSLTESNLTFQSFYSVESSGGAQSKGTADFVPNDNDLLSSILVGRSTGLKMKPTPPLPNTVRTKRQRTAVRSVVHKRKLLIDDSTVLHGDTIRQQLTSTEDIRRVRKKAPCTHLEVWVLQKQFLEDQIFGESVFTGMFPALQLLDTEEFDLNGIQILRDDKNKDASEADIATTRPTLGEDTEAIGPFGPSIADISTGPKPNEETKDAGPPPSSMAETDGPQMNGGCLLETPCEQEPSLTNNDVIDKTSIEFDNSRTFLSGEVMQSVGCSPESNYNLNNPNVDLNSLNKSSDVVTPMITDSSDQLLDQRSPLHRTIGDDPTMQDVSRLGVQDQGLDFSLDERSGGEHLLEKREDFDTNVISGVEGSNKDEILDVSLIHDGSFLTSEKVGEHVNLDSSVFVETGLVSNKDEILDASLIHDGSLPTSEKVGEHVNLDSSDFVEMDLGSEKTTLIEMEGEEDDPKIILDTTTEFIDTSNAEFKTDVIEHDTDFLNVDDDDDVEDYESDMPCPEEKRILDNSGWSSRTRAVANYLQGLFEKEYDPEKRVVSLDNLLVGKTCKEASRMFFETLVLKTKDYIQTEQETSFSDIRLKPRGKLLNSEFRSHA